MGINAAHLEIRLSGGSGNTNPSASLGGVMSSQRVLAQEATGLASITGVVIDYAGGNSQGNGTLTFTAATKQLKWQPSGGLVGSAVGVEDGGKFVVADYLGKQQLMVTITPGSLPVGNQTDIISVATFPNKIFDDVTKQESFSGMIDYRCDYVKNTHPSETAYGVSLIIESNTVGGDSVYLGLDPAGVGGVATTIANETTAPSGVAFSQPSEDIPLLIGSLAPGQAAAFWQKRNVPALTSIAELNDISVISVLAYL